MSSRITIIAVTASVTVNSLVYFSPIFERDNHDRMLWFQTANRRHESPERVEMLARRAMDTDSTNLEMVTRILAETGYPRKSRVGDFASQAIRQRPWKSSEVAMTSMGRPGE